MIDFAFYFCTTVSFFLLHYTKTDSLFVCKLDKKRNFDFEASMLSFELTLAILISKLHPLTIWLTQTDFDYC